VTTTLTAWAMWIDGHRFVASLGLAGAAIAATLALLLAWLAARRLGRAACWAAARIGAAQTTPGTTLLYLAALVALGNNAATSWTFFGTKVHIAHVTERVALFAVVELALLACTAAMRATVRRSKPGEPRRAGPAGTVAWSLCGLTALMAWEVSGPVVGTVRVLAGAVLYEVLLHLALGIERRDRTGEPSTFARIVAELRERVLSRLGLGDDTRDAATRTRDRAADRAARLVVSKRAPLRKSRLQRALRVSGVASDPQRMDRMLAGITVLQRADELASLDRPAPWTGPAQTGTDEQTSTPDRATTPNQTGQIATGPEATVVVRAQRPAAEANGRVLAVLFPDRLPGSREVRRKLQWGGSRTTDALRYLRRSRIERRGGPGIHEEEGYSSAAAGDAT
jgi:hypothetical protein